MKDGLVCVACGWTNSVASLCSVQTDSAEWADARQAQAGSQDVAGRHGAMGLD
jgi:hypothetical protein